MQSDSSEESSIDGVINRSIDALSEIAGLRSSVSLNDPSITVHGACVDDIITPKNGKAKKMREQKETEKEVFMNFWTAIDRFRFNKPFHLQYSKFVLKAIKSFDLKQRQNGRVDTLGKTVSIKARYAAKDDVDLDIPVGKGVISNTCGTKTTCLCRGTVVKLIQDETKNYYVILACYDKLVGNKYFMSQDEDQQLLNDSNQGEKNPITMDT
jgi:hypothetical protein